MHNVAKANEGSEGPTTRVLPCAFERETSAVENASGWALAPFVGLRHVVHQSSKDVSDLSVQLPAWTQAAGPLVIEKVAASVMVVAIAISGTTGSAPTSPRTPGTSGSASLAQAGSNHGLDSPSVGTTRAPKQREAPTLMADVGALLDDVRKTAEDQAGDKRSKDKDDRDGGGSVDPTNPDRASQKLVKKVNDTADEVLPDR